ncbi:MAG: DUF2723 domain-containing protein [Bacteroidales bacterium]|nr:DUF2723 domain-containing protein [Bacteroidales bacterium]
MKKYNLLNNIFGWVAFVISAIVYLLTVEPTASWWDCPEFITCASFLEVGHPPGNAFFNLTGRFFANFAGGDVTRIAVWINRMSALCSAGAILFLFWSITHLTKKIVYKDQNKEITLSQIITILGSGMVGALVYTFSDTFWFSAVEGEVYAFSSLLTALVFWLILKWEAKADDAHADRYIILLAYVIGLSIGVHLLNLLCIPAIVLVYYFKKFSNINLKGTLVALAISFVIIALLLYGLIPGFVKLAGYMELLFVNVFHFGYNTGTAFYFFLVLGLLIWSMYESWTGKNIKMIKLSFVLSVALIGVPFIGSGYWLGILLTIIFAGGIFYWKTPNMKILNTISLSLFVILIGYSTFAQIIIRSSANTPMDQNSPDNIFSFAKYLGREQYGDRPLFYGYTFVSDVQRDEQGKASTKQGEPIYAKVVKENDSQPDKYVISGYKENFIYNPELDMLFPRMYSKTEPHVSAYKEWTNFKGKPVKVFKDGQNQVVSMPTFGENLKFFFKYQLNYMYWRYFMWNFSGRQNDLQGYGEITKGNWITGFNFIDKYLVGDQSDLPADMKDNKGRNVYFLLPLILGILGLVYQANSGEKGIQGFWIVFFLFIMTGIAIVFYLNQTPYQPRERDYAYAGSFYAFSVWVGMGVAALVNYLQKYLKPSIAAPAVAIITLAVPIQMGAQNWDDHDRSNRYIARDMGYNYLSCVDDNGIIFTNGDNDTFPLWYAQEVEGYRRDVRVCNLSYLQTDWYITQMKSPSYTSQSLPINISPAAYDQSKLNFAYVINVSKEPLALSTAMNWLTSEDKRTKTLQGSNERVDYIPANDLFINIDSSAVASSPLFKGIDKDSITKRMNLNYSSKNAVIKNEIAVLSMIDEISKANWNRPIYYSSTVGSDMYMGLEPYFTMAGLAYQITPVNGGGIENVNTEKSYDILMNKFLWGGIDNPKVYLDENSRRTARILRMRFSLLIDALIAEGKNDKALNALDYCMEKIPEVNVPYDYSEMKPLAAAYIQVGEKKKGEDIMIKLANKSLDNLRWYFSLSPSMFDSVVSSAWNDLAVVYNLIGSLKESGNTQKAEEIQKSFDVYQTAWSTLNGKGSI